MPRQPNDTEDDTTRRVNDLSRIEPDLVSVVRRGANRSRLVLKSEEGDMPDPDVKKDQFGNPIADDAPAAAPPAADPTDAQPADKGDPPPADPPNQDPPADPPAADKGDTMPGAVKTKVSETLTAIVERAKALIGVVNGIGTDEKSAKPIPSKVEQEVRAIAASVNGILGQNPAPAAAVQDADPPPADKEDGLEDMATAIGKAAEADTLSKRDVNMFRKMFVNMRKLLEKIDPNAKEAMKGFDIVLKSLEEQPSAADTVLRTELSKAMDTVKTLTDKVVEMEKKSTEQAEKIAKMAREVPEGNASLFSWPTDDKPAAAEDGDNFHFGGWDPADELKKKNAV